MNEIDQVKRQDEFDMKYMHYTKIKWSSNFTVQTVT